MIGIATLTVDTNGDIIFWESPDSNIEDTQLRVTRTATLDGGCVISNSGFSESDRTFEIDTELEDTEANKLRYIYQKSESVYVSTIIGFFKGIISRFRNLNGDIRLTILIEEKTNA